MLGDEFWGEAWPGGEEILVDGLRPGGAGLAEACTMQKIDELHLGFLFVSTVSVMLVGWMLGW